MTEEAVYSISVDGTEVTRRFTPFLEALTLRLYDGGQSDTLELLLDDSRGRLRLPRVGASLSASLSWRGGGQALNFVGKTDEPRSRGGRDAGRLLALTATGTDFLSAVKEKQQGHVDDSTFEQAAQKFGAKAHITVKVDRSLAGVHRDWWGIQNESFAAWGKRIAAEIGATFKLYGTRAVFVPRNGGASVSGRALATVTAEWGRNLAEWDLAPTQSRPRFGKAVVGLFNPKTGKFENVEVATGDSSAPVAHIDVQRAPNYAQARARAAANAREIARGKGGGWVLIDGDPAAQPQAPLVVSGVRPGIDGTYRIASVTHTLTRAAGWLTECEVEEPSGAAGDDER
jgi:phage protein D